MIESTRPMRDGKLPFQLGSVGVNADYPFLGGNMTNMEIIPGGIGYLPDGYGPMDMSGTATTSGFASIQYYGYTSRTVYMGLYDYETFFTPQFGVTVFQDDLINKKWTGVTYTIVGPATQTNNGTPYPYDQNFMYTFTAANDPTYGSGTFISPSQDSRIIDGTEYLSVGVYGGGTTVLITNAGNDITTWNLTGVSPPP